LAGTPRNLRPQAIERLDPAGARVFADHGADGLADIRDRLELTGVEGRDVDGVDADRSRRPLVCPQLEPVHSGHGDEVGILLQQGRDHLIGAGMVDHRNSFGAGMPRTCQPNRRSPAGL
jgi:hypothetical protein